MDELTIIVAPIILGGGKRLFEGFEQDVELEHIGVRQSPLATFIDYRVAKQARADLPRRPPPVPADWNPSKPLEEQSGRAEHAELMDALVEDGFIVLGGPLADEHRVVLVCEAGSRKSSTRRSPATRGRGRTSRPRPSSRGRSGSTTPRQWVLGDRRAAYGFDVAAHVGHRLRVRVAKRLLHTAHVLLGPGRT